MSAEKAPEPALETAPGRTPWPRGPLVAIAAAAFLVFLFLLGRLASPARPGDFLVRRGTLRFTVPFVGTLVPERSDSYAADVPGVELKILWLADEGTLVSPGNPLIRFDPAPFQRDLETAQARLRELTEETEQARLAMTATRLAQRSELREAESAAGSAERDLTAYVNTAAPLTVQESAHNLEQKQRESEEAESKLSGLEPFVSEGFVSQEEYRAARSRRDQAAADLRLAHSQYEALIRQTAPDLVKQKTEEMKTREMQLSVQQEKSGAQIAQAAAAFRLAGARRDEAARQAAEAERKISRCNVAARSSGLVVYGEMFDKSGERRKVRVGDSVWGGTPVLLLPDLTRLRIEGKVPESEIHSLSPGQPVRARLDAFPGVELSGRLLRVGSLGTSEKNESRSFPVVAALSQTDPRFRPGMIARAFADSGRAENVLYVPIEAVRAGAGGEACLVVSPFGRTVLRPVVTGRNTSQEVEVLKGLKEGDLVRIGEN